MKSSASESKPFQSRSKGEIPGWARRKERLRRSKLKRAFLTDSDAELFMYLIQCIRFGSWKVRRLNRALQNRSQERFFSSTLEIFWKEVFIIRNTVRKGKSWCLAIICRKWSAFDMQFHLIVVLLFLKTCVKDDRGDSSAWLLESKEGFD